MAIKFVCPVHSGEFLSEEYLVPLGMSAGALSKKLNIPRRRIERIVKEEIGVTSDTALRLGKFFGTTPEFWLNFQIAYELAAGAKDIESELDRIVAYADERGRLISPSAAPANRRRCDRRKTP